jgi:hypothetical protein
MKTLMKSAAAVSTVALLALGTLSVPSLAQKTYDDGCPPGVDNCRDDDEGNNRKRPRFDDDNNSGSYDGQVSDKRRAQSDWKFDSNRHERRRAKDDKFRFFFGGFWYPAPYWTGAYGYAPSSRISCGEGRYIVDRRFNRVRTIECSGSTYTYVGRRDGDSWRVMFKARRGRIVCARPI